MIHYRLKMDTPTETDVFLRAVEAAKCIVQTNALLHSTAAGFLNAGLAPLLHEKRASMCVSQQQQQQQQQQQIVSPSNNNKSSSSSSKRRSVSDGDHHPSISAELEDGLISTTLSPSSSSNQQQQQQDDEETTISISKNNIIDTTTTTNNDDDTDTSLLLSSLSAEEAEEEKKHHLESKVQHTWNFIRNHFYCSRSSTSSSSVVDCCHTNTNTSGDDDYDDCSAITMLEFNTPPPPCSKATTTTTKQCEYHDNDDVQQQQQQAYSVLLPLEDEDQTLLNAYDWYTRQCLTAFTATQEDILTFNNNNNNKLIQPNQVGIRCIFCSHLGFNNNNNNQSSSSSSCCFFPSSLEDIHTSMIQWRDSTHHFNTCMCIPTKVRQQFQSFLLVKEEEEDAADASLLLPPKEDVTERYVACAAAALGMVNTTNNCGGGSTDEDEHGIRFGAAAVPSSSSSSSSSLLLFNDEYGNRMDDDTDTAVSSLLSEEDCSYGDGSTAAVSYDNNDNEYDNNKHEQEEGTDCYSEEQIQYCYHVDVPCTVHWGVHVGPLLDPTHTPTPKKQQLHQQQQPPILPTCHGLLVSGIQHQQQHQQQQHSCLYQLGIRNHDVISCINGKSLIGIPWTEAVDIVIRSVQKDHRLTIQRTRTRPCSAKRKYDEDEDDSARSSSKHHPHHPDNNDEDGAAADVDVDDIDALSLTVRENMVGWYRRRRCPDDDDEDHHHDCKNNNDPNNDEKGCCAAAAYDRGQIVSINNKDDDDDDDSTSKSKSCIFQRDEDGKILQNVAISDLRGLYSEKHLKCNNSSDVRRVYVGMVTEFHRKNHRSTCSSSSSNHTNYETPRMTRSQTRVVTAKKKKQQQQREIQLVRGIVCRVMMDDDDVDDKGNKGSVLIRPLWNIIDGNDNNDDELDTDATSVDYDDKEDLVVVKVEDLMYWHVPMSTSLQHLAQVHESNNNVAAVSSTSSSSSQRVVNSSHMQQQQQQEHQQQQHSETSNKNNQRNKSHEAPTVKSKVHVSYKQELPQLQTAQSLVTTKTMEWMIKFHELKQYFMLGHPHSNAATMQADNAEHIMCNLIRPELYHWMELQRSMYSHNRMMLEMGQQRMVLLKSIGFPWQSSSLLSMSSQQPGLQTSKPVKTSVGVENNSTENIVRSPVVELVSAQSNEKNQNVEEIEETLKTTGSVHKQEPVALMEQGGTQSNAVSKDNLPISPSKMKILGDVMTANTETATVTTKDSSLASSSTTSVTAAPDKCYDQDEEDIPSLSSPFNTAPYFYQTKLERREKRVRNESLSSFLAYKKICTNERNARNSTDETCTLEKQEYIKNATWLLKFDELRCYKQQHGNCLVPESDRQLGPWVRMQREQYQYFREKRYTIMTQAKIILLDSIGFELAGHHSITTCIFEGGTQPQRKLEVKECAQEDNFRLLSEECPDALVWMKKQLSRFNRVQNYGLKSSALAQQDKDIQASIATNSAEKQGENENEIETHEGIVETVPNDIGSNSDMERISIRTSPVKVAASSYSKDAHNVDPVALFSGGSSSVDNNDKKKCAHAQRSDIDTTDNSTHKIAILDPTITAVTLTTPDSKRSSASYASASSEIWFVEHIYTKQEITSKDAIRCQTEHCNLPACALWASSNEGESTWNSCLDCQERDFAGWPDDEEVEEKIQDEEFMMFLRTHCSQKTAMHEEEDGIVDDEEASWNSCY